MNRTVRMLLCAVLPILLAAALFFGVRYGANAPSELACLTAEGTQGAPVAAYSVEDLPGMRTVPYANYTAGKFLMPGSEIGGERIDLTKTNCFEGRGTLQFVFLNLDPFDSDFTAKSERLAPYLGGDAMWHFTLYLPPVTGAVNVYLRTEFVASAGQISDYNFIEYTEYSEATQEHVTASEPLFLDLPFYSKRHAMSPDLVIRATTVTVHFEAKEGTGALLLSAPLAGTQGEVRSAVGRDSTFELGLSVAAIITLAAFLFAAVLKRTVSFLPQIAVVGGILGSAFFRRSLFTACAYPFTACAFIGIFSALIPLAAVCSMREKIGAFPLWLLFAVLTVLPAVTAFLLPPFAVNAGMAAADAVLRGCIALFLLVLIVLSVLRGREASRVVTASLAAVYAPCSAAGDAALLFLSPASWLSLLILAASALFGCIFFVRIERQNRFLTENLQSEVSRQTTELRGIIEDRDKLLRYLSHDMKKPALRIGQAVAALKPQESDPARLRALAEIEDKIRVICTGLTELQHYAKQTNASEPSVTVDAAEIVEYMRSSLQPDCEANGIRMSARAVSVRVFAKRNLLISVLSNLIFNAIEHAACGEIAVTAEELHGCCLFRVTDDGKGIAAGEEVFRPYYSEGAADTNMGLGLYLCRQFMHAMGGDLTYERVGKKTVFTASLPLSPLPANGQ